MGKAARARRLKQERERERAARGAPAAGAAGAAFRAGPRSRSSGNSSGNKVPSEQALAAGVIGEATRAFRTGDQDGYSACLRQLADERTPGWTRMVGESLVESLRTSVRAAWRHGWQPAELVRHVGRELSGEHASVAADMITDEMSGYAAATVDPRWAAQVAALDPTAPGDAGYLDAWRLANVAGLRGAAANAIETLHALQQLRVLERLLPLPGTARPTAQVMTETVDERMLSRIRALLSKAESTEFAEEAEALSARAQQLMAKYSIDHALLAAESGSAEAPGGRRLAVDNPYEAPKATLLQTVAQANRCRVVWSKELGLLTVVGFPADLDAVELLFTSLLVQANGAMLRAGGRKDAYGRSRTRAFRQSFLVSYAVRIGERLAEAAGHAEQQAVAEQQAAQERGAGQTAAARASGKDLVPFLAARHRAVDDAVDGMFGDGLTRTRAVRATDTEGWYSGRAAADLASLHGRTPVD
ncbi:MAG: DUF2786 domain-containing protein [Trebonia sp.]